jgi:nitrate reductase gamma subunit
MAMSGFLHFAQHRLQEICLVIMALVYTTRLIWLFRFKLGKERQATTSRRNTDRSKGAMYSFFNVAMPWSMESTRRRPLFYLQFAVFHAGVIAAIGMSFVIPYAPQLLTPSMVLALQVIMGAACVVGVLRLIRRVANPYMRAISTPDDYFSLILMTVWFFFATLAAPQGTAARGEWASLTYFLLTAFFLLYVPFSKISHYLYYPFGRLYLGRTLGHRGVFPLQRGPRPENAPNLEPHALEVAEAAKEG